jgi:hypothetical protein
VKVGAVVAPFIAYPGMAEDSCAGRANSVKAHARDSGDLLVGLDRVCARATLPLSGAGRVLKADSETCTVLLLPPRGDFLLRGNCLLGADLERLRGLL